jgi:hypothetical protein
MTINPLANLGRCAYCGLTGDAALFEKFNRSNLVCKATAACEVRRSGNSAAYVLGKLLRAVRSELALATDEELAELHLDLLGYELAVVAELATRQGGAEALTAAQAHRAALAARKAATS